MIFLRASGEAILGTQRSLLKAIPYVFVLRASGEAILGTQRYAYSTQLTAEARGINKPPNFDFSKIG